MPKQTSKWDDSQIEILTNLLAENIPTPTIAKALGRSVKAVERKIESSGMKRPNKDPEMPDHVTDADHWREEFSRVCRELRAERKRNKAVHVLVEDIKEHAPASYKTAPPVTWPKVVGSSKPQSAVLLLSDTHVGQVVEPEQTQGFGEYSFPTFLRRLKRLEVTIHSILSEHVNTKVDELVVGMLGDMLHGALDHSEEAGQRSVIFNQMYGAGHAFAQFFRNLATLVPTLRVHTTVGNHTRWGTQKKMPAKNRFSNFDQFLYAYVEALTKDIPNIKWHITQEPFATFDVQGFKFWASHGEELKGGDKALGIPVHSMGRRISSVSQMMASTGMQPVNYYVFGHHHKPMSLPHTMGEMLCNGCFAGMDNFSYTAGFNPIEPQQKFFMMHPKFGRSATYDIKLKLAETDGPLPYNIPEGFPVS